MDTLAAQVEDERRRINGILESIQTRTGRTLTPAQQARVMRDLAAFGSATHTPINAANSRNIAPVTREALSQLSASLGNDQDDRHEHHDELVAELAHVLASEHSAAILDVQLSHDLAMPD